MTRVSQVPTAATDVRLAESVRARSLRQFHRGLAQVSAAPVDIVFLGDSITEGLNATVIGASGTRFVDLVRDRLRVKWPVAGVAGGAGYLPIYQPFVTSSWSAVTGASDFTAHGLGYKAWVGSAGGHGASLAFTGTGLDIVYVKAPGYGTFSWAIDGGGTTNVDTSTASDGDGYVASIRSLANTSHTLAIARVSGAMIVDGTMVYRQDEAAGIRVWDAGHGGQTLGDGGDDVLGPSKGYWESVVGTIQPALVIVCFGLNNYSDGTNPALLQSGIATLMSDVRAKCTVSPSFVLMVPYLRGDVINPTYPWSQYVAAIYAAATADGYAGVCDLGQRFDNDPLPSYNASVGLVNASNKVHPLDLGHSLIANTIVGYLQP